MINKLDNPEASRGSLRETQVGVFVGARRHLWIEVGLLLIGGQNGPDPSDERVQGSVESGVDFVLELRQVQLLPLQAVGVLRS